jgi:hypothetical protein
VAKEEVMNVNTFRKIALVLLVGFSAGLCAACTTELGTDERCGWCKGEIITFPKNHGGFSVTYHTDFKTLNGEIFHPWCAKIYRNEKAD